MAEFNTENVTLFWCPIVVSDFVILKKSPTAISLYPLPLSTATPLQRQSNLENGTFVYQKKEDTKINTVSFPFNSLSAWCTQGT